MNLPRTSVASLKPRDLLVVHTAEVRTLRRELEFIYRQLEQRRPVGPFETPDQRNARDAGWDGNLIFCARLGIRDTLVRIDELFPEEHEAVDSERR